MWQPLLPARSGSRIQSLQSFVLNHMSLKAMSLLPLVSRFGSSRAEALYAKRVLVMCTASKYARIQASMYTGI